MVSIRSISIKALRGCPNTTVELGKRGLLVLGDNGSGKSSIVDSLEYFFTGDLNHISTVQSVPISSLITIGMNREDLDVALEIEDDSGIHEVSRDEDCGLSQNIPSSFADYVDAAQSLDTILRRRSIVDFVNNIPSERYKILAEMIGITEFRSKLMAAQRCRNDWEAKAQKTKKVRDDIIQELESEFSATNESEITGHLNVLLEKALSAKAENIRDTIDITENWLAEYSSESKRRKCLDMLDRVHESLDSIEKSIEEFQESLRSLSEEDPSQYYVSLLKNAKFLIEEGFEDMCPLCEQEIEISTLLNRVQEKLSSLESLSKMFATMEEDKEEIIAEKENIVSEIEEAKNEIEDVRELNTYTAAFDQLCSDLNNAISSESLFDSSSIQSEINDLESCITETELSSTSDELETEISSIYDKAEKASDLLEALQRQRTLLSKMESAFEDADTIFKSFRDAGKKVVKSYVVPILDDINDYFEFLHPKDEHREIDISMQPSRTASVEITLQSFGLEPTDPRAYSSEGHLDSLGLCIFLAFAKHFHRPCSLIVLDDVVSSIDANHRARIAKLLLEKFEDYQLLITTHDRVWAESLRRYIQAKNLMSDFLMEEIVQWTKDTGPIFDSFKDDWNLVNQYLGQRGGHIAAGNLGRQILERTLRSACDNLQVSLKYRDDERRRTLNYFLQGLKNFINDEFPALGSGLEELMGTITDVEATVVWANVSSHDHPLSNRFSSGEVRAFLEAVKNLQEHLLCGHCSSPLVKRSGEVTIHCKNRSCPNPTEIQ